MVKTLVETLTPKFQNPKRINVSTNVSTNVLTNVLTNVSIHVSIHVLTYVSTCISIITSVSIITCLNFHFDILMNKIKCKLKEILCQNFIEVTIRFTSFLILKSQKHWQVKKSPVFLSNKYKQFLEREKKNLNQYSLEKVFFWKKKKNLEANKVVKRKKTSFPFWFSGALRAVWFTSPNQIF